MKIFKAYKYRLYPTKEQEVLLAKHFGCVRWVFNYGLARKIAYYTKEKKTLSRFEIQKEIVKLKKQKATSWLAEVTAQSLQESLINLDMAYTRFFREKKGFPKFKNKKSKQSVQFTQYTKVKFENNKLYVMKFREGIKCKFSRRFNGIIKTTTISKTLTNKYYVSILTKENIVRPIKLNPKIETAIGIDLGIKTFITISNGDVFDSPKYLKKSLKKLKKIQRKYSHKKKGSNNKIKQKIKIAKLHEKISNRRNDFLHKTSTQLINDKQVNTYCIEDLDVIRMMKNCYFAQAISDAGWSTFISYLKYKADWANKNILQIGRFEPSSKTCNKCGSINHALTLKDRNWICKCGAKHDRDFLASCNIRDFAFDKQNLIGLGKSKSTLEEIEKVSVDESRSCI